MKKKDNNVRKEDNNVGKHKKYIEIILKEQMCSR